MLDSVLPNRDFISCLIFLVTLEGEDGNLELSRLGLQKIFFPLTVEDLADDASYDLEISSARFACSRLAIYSRNNVTYFTDVRNVYCIFYSVDKLQLPLPSCAVASREYSSRAFTVYLPVYTQMPLFFPAIFIDAQRITSAAQLLPVAGYQILRSKSINRLVRAVKRVHNLRDPRFHARDIKLAPKVYEGNFGQNPGLLQGGGCNRYSACPLTDTLALVSILYDGRKYLVLV
ncbi:hypothetical protein EAG_03999 [Camponotus floridanus]|uniref:Uncharacterized protein n=1 Tax=Camponotus floridanus TaxID=104421 RepID=E2A461_CAMFO|nr:hypothetical protein EAG_03999 [Camponotus floridanus]